MISIQLKSSPLTTEFNTEAKAACESCDRRNNIEVSHVVATDIQMVLGSGVIESYSIEQVRRSLSPRAMIPTLSLPVLPRSDRSPVAQTAPV